MSPSRRIAQRRMDDWEAEQDQIERENRRQEAQETRAINEQIEREEREWAKAQQPKGKS